MLLAERGHDVVPVARPGGSSRALAKELGAERLDAGDPRIRELVSGCDAVLHFAGVPNPARARADPARAVRENVGTTLNLLEACAEHGAGLIYPSTVRAAVESPPGSLCALQAAWRGAVPPASRAPATVVRLTSVFGPGQVAWEGATGAIAVFAARALEGASIVIPGNPERARDFLYVDDVVARLERIVSERRWNQVLRAGERRLDAAAARRRAGSRGGRIVVADRDAGRDSPARARTRATRASPMPRG